MFRVAVGAGVGVGVLRAAGEAVDPTAYGARGPSGDAVSASRDAAAHAGDVHCFQSPLSVPPTVLPRPWSLHHHRTPHTQT